jgi:hypothetical protein
MAARLPRTDGTHPRNRDRAEEYLALLTKLLAGGRVKSVDAADLDRLVGDAGLDQAEVRRLNALAWARVIAAAGEPARLNQRSLKALADAAACLGFAEDAARFQRSVAGAPEAGPSRSAPLKGWRIGLVPGSPQASAAAQYAVTQGAALAKRLTKTVRILIADDPNADNDLIVQGRELGLRILTPAQASRELRSAVDAAATKQRADEAHRLQRERESDAYWGHRWRSREADPVWGWDEESVRVHLR